MTITPAALTRLSGLAGVGAGLVFVGVQINHPPLNATTIPTTEVVVRNSLKILMAVLALAGITGMYASRIRRNGLLGLVGYVVLAPPIGQPFLLQRRRRGVRRPSDGGVHCEGAVTLSCNVVLGSSLNLLYSRLLR